MVIGLYVKARIKRWRTGIGKAKLESRNWKIENPKSKKRKEKSENRKAKIGASRQWSVTGCSQQRMVDCGERTFFNPKSQIQNRQSKIGCPSP
jgi:hypothetical protein